MTSSLFDKMLTFFNTRLVLTALMAALLLLTRQYIWLNPPPFFSDVTADYERYANTWYYGLTPYREILYEYPPATIPLLLVPLQLDQAGYGKYYPNYRAGVMIIDLAFGAFLLTTIALKFPWSRNRKLSAMMIYLGLTALGRAFYYEGIDVAFTASAVSAYLLTLWLPSGNWAAQLAMWCLFWLSTCIKFLTIPLVVPLFWWTRRHFVVSAVLCMVGLLLIWGIPLAKYRSSLSVSFVYNNNRPLKYASFPSYIIQTINVYTQTESQVSKAPDFQYVGPVSTVVTNVTKVVFPLSILLVILVTSWWAWHDRHQWFHVMLPAVQQPELVYRLLQMHGLYVFTIFLTAKIFSQPFHIWYMAVVALLPYKSRRVAVGAVLASLIMIVLDMTEWVQIQPVTWAGIYWPLNSLRDLCRFLPMMWLLGVLLRGLSIPRSRGE